MSRRPLCFAVRHLVLGSFFLLSAHCLLPAALGQSTTATLSGAVEDQNGAVVPGASVTIENSATGLKRQTTTNSEGVFTVPLLPPGKYTIRAQHEGFTTAQINDVVLNVGDQKAVTIQLKTGDLKETVVITGEAPLISESPSVGTVVDRQFVENIPLNGRSFNTLLQLTPGVVIASTTNLGDTSSSGQFSIAGQRTDANSFSVDGVSANFGVVATANLGNSGTGSVQAFSAIGGTSSLVSADALQEFRIETSSYAPEFGRSPGGQVILTTRSGTNGFHGDAFEYFRNDKLDANDWFANAAKKPRAPERHNDFGGVFGGPILRNRTFFFFSYEGSRLRIPQNGVVNVPSMFARNTASASLSPYVKTYPLPDDKTVTPGVYTSKFTSSFSNSSTLNATAIRVDHKFNDRFSVFGRYNYAPSQLVSRPTLINFLQTSLANVQTATFGSTMSLRSNLWNSLRGNFSQDKAGTLYAIDSFAGATPIDPSLVLGSLSLSDSAGFFQFNDATNYRVGVNARNRVRQINLIDDLSWTYRSHQLKVGGDYRAIFLNRNPFRASITAVATSVQAFLTTGTASVTPQVAVPTQLLGQAFSLYGQDTWKVKPRLSLTYGVRWELAPPPSGRNGTAIAAWLNTNDPSTVALAPLGTPPWKTTHGNFAPRVGIAYNVTKRGDLVIRGAFGIFYDATLGQAGAIAGFYPTSASGTPASRALPISDYGPFLPVITTTPPYSGVIAGFANDLVMPRSYQWNVAVEKSFGATNAVSATYIGQAGRDLLRNEGLVKPNANFANGTFLTLEKNTAWSNYDALQLQYRRRMSARFEGLVNYSWSHSLDNISNDSIQSVSNTVLSGAQDYSSSNFDVRHSFSAAVTYDVPHVGRSAALKAVVNGWAISSVVVARTGFPFNGVILGGAPGGISIRRPNLTGAPIWIADPTVAGGKALNTAAFQIPPTGQQGTEGRNDIRGFALFQADLSVSRKFKITERFGVQFRADAFNVLNHPNFTNPVALVTSSAALRSASMLNSGLGGLNSLFQEGGPRSLQLSLRLFF